MTRRHIFLAVFVVLIVLSAFMTVEGQSALGATDSYTMKVNYHILGEGLPTAPTITYVTPEGNQETKTIPLAPDILSITMGKNKPWSVTPNPLTSPTNLERWISTQTLSGTTPNSGGSTTKTFSFQHQYKLTVVSPYDTPSGTGWYNSGATAYAQLSQTTVQGSSGIRYVFIAWSEDASGTNNKSNQITMNEPKTATANWKTQYQVTLNVNPLFAGTTSPHGTSYYDTGLTLSIAANVYDDNKFAAWTQTGTITIANPAAQTTTATIDSPGTITANFDSATFLRITHLTVNCNPTETGLNQPVTLSGILTNKDNQPVSGKTVTLFYCPTANSYGWTTIGTATTAQDGTYTQEWTTNMPQGSYFVMAKFNGDLKYRASNAIASSDGASLTVVPEYIFGGLAALGACFLSFLAFKKRSSLLNLKWL